MSLKEKLKDSKFIITSEIVPPKGIDIEKLLDNAQKLNNRVDAFNITDIQSSNMKLGSLAVSSLFKQNGFEPIYQLTCRDRNRLALQSDILSAAVLGVENILILTGDYPSVGDHPQTKPVFDLDSVQLLQALTMLQQGSDMNGNKLLGKAPKFCVGAVVNPGAEPLEPQVLKMEKKIVAGVDFFQTQVVFDCEKFEKFVNRVKHLNVPIIAGILLLKSAKMAKYMNEHVAGVEVPEYLVKEFDTDCNREEKCVEIAVRIINKIRPMCQGIHLMPIGWDRLVPKILDAVGL